jgi:hypothetical protein
MIESTTICLINGSIFRDLEVPYKVQIDSAKVILQSSNLSQQEFPCTLLDNVIQVRVLATNTTQYVNRVVKMLVIGESTLGFREVIHKETLSFSVLI